MFLYSKYSIQKKHNTVNIFFIRRQIKETCEICKENGEIMITKTKKKDAQHRAAELMRSAGIHIGDDEIEKIEVADFGTYTLRYG